MEGKEGALAGVGKRHGGRSVGGGSREWRVFSVGRRGGSDRRRGEKRNTTRGLEFRILKKEKVSLNIGNLRPFARAAAIEVKLENNVIERAILEPDLLVTKLTLQCERANI